jgi:glycosyltransferase involved in cell wall biosynthesis
MVNVVHFGKFYFPNTGGIESVTLSLSNGAVRAGYDVSVVCFGKGLFNEEDVIHNVRVIRKSFAMVVASQPIGLKYFISCILNARNAHIVHLHVPNMLGALCALLIRPQKKLLVHWHSDVIKKGFLGKILRPLEYMLLRRADIIVATSQVYADASKTLSHFKSKISIVPIGVAEKKLLGDGVALPSTLEKQINGRKVILSVGRLVSYKGFDVLIRAAQHFDKDSVIVIVGSGPLEAELQKSIEMGNVGDKVILAGALENSALNALFRRATIYCLPSTHRAEAFGVVLLEALAHGLPIVASDIAGSGVPWVNQHEISGLNVAVLDSIALAEACNKILRSVELRSKLSKGARERFLAEFTEEVFVNRMLAVYERLASI